MPSPVPADQLRRVCDPESLGFTSTAELSPLDGLIGQERALAATAFGISIQAHGYNLFVVGPPGTGKASTMDRAIAERAARDPTPPDFCYVHNFEDPYRPRALELPPGRGRELRALLAQFIEQCQARLPGAFEGEEFSRRATAIADELRQRERSLVSEIEELAQHDGFVALRGEDGLSVNYAPEGKPYSPEEFQALPTEERRGLEERAHQLESRVEPLVRQIRDLARGAEERRDRLLREVATAVARELLAEARARFESVPGVLAQLAAVEADLVDHAAVLHPAEEEGEEVEVEEDGDDIGGVNHGPLAFFDHYRVNVLVDGKEGRGAPILVETNPTYPNLVGRVEHRAQLGTLVTDFTLIRPGALHRANGGYLILEARDLVDDPTAWEALKRALKSRSLRIEDPPEESRAFAATGLAPEPIALRLKVVLLGSPELYQLLFALDEEVRELFKVKVEFDESIERVPESERLYGRFVAATCREQGLLPFGAAAVARLVEHGARLAEHQGRLTACFGDLADVVREAAYWAEVHGHALVEEADLTAAIRLRAERANLVERELFRLTLDGPLRVATFGGVVGQVNGLTVASTGDYEFGRPVRITARAHPGRPGLVDIERETGLGGALHSKGVLILSGYLAGGFAVDRPLALAASVACEQSYDEIDGDSASLAELAALLSAIAGLPVDQHLAVTGSVDQHGRVQAVGGVNEKVEGFFALCLARGLDGGHGVIVPRDNLPHLMLEPAIVAAARAGRFHLHAVATVDEAVALLTGRPAGERDPGDGGRFPPDSVNRLVEQRLERWAVAAVNRP